MTALDSASNGHSDSLRVDCRALMLIAVSPYPTIDRLLTSALRGPPVTLGAEQQQRAHRARLPLGLLVPLRSVAPDQTERRACWRVIPPLLCAASAPPAGRCGCRAAALVASPLLPRLGLLGGCAGSGFIADKLKANRHDQ